LIIGLTPPGTPGLPEILAASEFKRIAVYPRFSLPPFLVVKSIVAVLPDSSKLNVVTDA
jgi:hypothetical protein